MSFPKRTQKWLKHYLEDPLVKILLQNSVLTRTQLETLLIDVLAENLVEKRLKYQEKAQIRLLAVTRGAFNRTLRQARQNVIKSIYTLLLLGYLGIFEDTSLNPYLEIANKLQGYINVHKDVLISRPTEDQRLRIISKLREELEGSLEHLSNPKAFST